MQWQAVAGRWTLHVSSSCTFDNNNAAVISILLVKAGVEENPGPSGIWSCLCCCIDIDDKEERQQLLRNPSVNSSEINYHHERLVVTANPRRTQQILRKSYNSNCYTRATLLPSVSSISSNGSDNHETSSYQSWEVLPTPTTTNKHAGKVLETEAMVHQRSGEAASRAPEQRFKKVKGFADMSGELYEIKVSALMFIRALNRGENFHLASNMEAGGSLDDIVFTVGRHTMFLQLKHRKASDKKISTSQLLLTNGNFSIFKYYKSYVKIMQQWTRDKDLKFRGRFEDSLFIIYTNAIMPEDSFHHVGSTEWQDMLRSGGKCIHVTEASYKTIYEWFQNVSDYKQMLEQSTDANLMLNETTKKLCKSKDFHNDLNSVENLAHYREFLSQLWFFSEQAGEHELDYLIKQEIMKAFGISGKDVDKICAKFLQDMQNWWKTSNKFLTESAALWKDIVATRIYNISERMLKSLRNLKVLKFNDEVISLLKSKLPCNGGIVNIVTNGTERSNVLSCLKVHQSLSNVQHMLVDGAAIQSRGYEVMTLWERWCDTLVIVEGGLIPINFFINHPNKNLIYISSSPAGICNAFHDEPKFDQLTSESQSELLKIPVLFQDYNVPIGEITGNDREMQNLISADIIFRLLQDNLLYIGGGALMEDSEYLIPRTLQCEHCVKMEIMCHELFSLLEDESPVLITLTGVTNEELHKLVPCNKEVNAESDLPEYGNRFQFCVIETEKDYQELAKTYKEIHWLHREGDTFIWKRSRGDMSVIMKYLQTDTCLFGNVKSVLDLPHNVILVSSGPGMGKSVLTNHLAHQTKSLNPSTWVLKVNLNDFSKELGDLPDEVQITDVLDFLLQTALIPEDFKLLFRFKIAEMENICILFDGFDEITPIYSNKVVRMIQHLQLTKVNKLWITTRPVMRKRLEHDLSTLALTLLPFTETQQHHFITSIWKKNLTGIDNVLLNEFCAKLLLMIRNNLSNNEKQFTSIPLQAMVLAEVFEGQLIRMQNTGRIEEPPKLDLLQLFDRFVERKLDAYYERDKINVSKAGISLVMSSFEEYMYQNHMYLALETVLPFEEFEMLLNSQCVSKAGSDFIAKFEEGYDHIGIIKETADGKPVFIHKTFAEYFVAKWFSNNYKHIGDYLRERLFDLDFQIIRHFLNRILAQNSNLHKAVLNCDLVVLQSLLLETKQDINIRDNGGRTCLHLAVMNYVDQSDYGRETTEIFKFLLNHGADSNTEDEILHWTPLYLAEKLKVWSAVDMLLQNRADSKDLVITRKNINNDTYIQDLLVKACKEGYVSVIKFLIDCGISVEYSVTTVETKLQSRVTMLHEAARHGQQRVVEYLLQHSACIDAKDSLHGRTPLMMAAWYGRSQIVNLLMKAGARIDIRDKYGHTALLFAAGSAKSESGERFCSDNTVHYAVGCGQVEAIRTLLHTNKLHVDCINNEHQTLLWCAVWGGQVGTVKMLVEHGADLHVRDTRRGWTPLHVAAKWGYLQITEYLVQHGASFSMQDNEGRTALNIAVLTGHTAIAQHLQSNHKRLMTE